MKKRMFRRCAVCGIAAVVLAAAVISAGCGSSFASGSADTEVMTADNGAEIQALGEEMSAETEDADLETEAAGYASAEELADEEGTEGTEPAAGEAASGDDTTDEIKKKIIYSADVSIDTQEYDSAKTSLTALIERYDAFVETSSEYNSGSSSASGRQDRRTWYVTIRVPAEHFDGFISDTGNVEGMITSKTISSSDLTKTYSDNEDKLEALQTEQKSLLKLLEKAENVDDMIAIQARLTEVRALIASLEDANSSIDYYAAYSTVNVTLNEVVVYESSGISFPERIENAFTGAGKVFAGALQGLLIFAIYALPFVLVIGIVVFAVWKIRKRKKKAKAVKKEEENLPE